MKKCCNCDNLVKTTSIDQTGTTLVLTIPATTKTKLCVVFAQSLPVITGIPSVVLKNGTTTLPIIESQHCVSHLLYADQLKQCRGSVASRQVLTIEYSEDLKLWQYTGCRRLPRTAAALAGEEVKDNDSY